MIKPSIIIFAFEPNANLLEEILLGIEEEGALFEIMYTTISDVKKSAYNAAYQSQVETGIGISGSRAALTLVKLPENVPLFEISAFDKNQWRSLGANAARLVSKRPLINIYTDMNNNLPLSPKTAMISSSQW